MPSECTQFYITQPTARRRKSGLCRSGSGRKLLAESSTMDDAVEKYLNLTSYYGQQVEMDNQGRLLLPQILRGTAKSGRGSGGIRKAALPGGA